MDEEIDEAGFGGHAEVGEVIATGCFGEGLLGPSFVVLVGGVAEIIAEVTAGDAGPIVEFSIDDDGVVLRRRRKLGCYLKSYDVGDHLVVVGIAVAAFHGLDVAGEFEVVAIDEVGVTFDEFFTHHFVGAFAGG